MSVDAAADLKRIVLEAEIVTTDAEALAFLAHLSQNMSALSRYVAMMAAASGDVLPWGLACAVLGERHRRRLTERGLAIVTAVADHLGDIEAGVAAHKEGTPS